MVKNSAMRNHNVTADITTTHSLLDQNSIAFPINSIQSQPGAMSILNKSPIPERNVNKMNKALESRKLVQNRLLELDQLKNVGSSDHELTGMATMNSTDRDRPSHRIHNTSIR